MKRVIFVFVLTALFTAAGFAQDNPFTSRDFQKVYDGSALTQPIDVQKLEKSALIVLARNNWVVQSDKDGKIDAIYEKDGGKINAVIEVSVSEDGYSIAYVSSKGLNVNFNTMKIHANYIKWVRNLIKDIAIEYLK